MIRRALGPRLSASVAAGLATSALTVWVAIPFLRPDRWVTGFDTVAYSGPNLLTSIREIRGGRIPQWNPAIFGGVTHVGNSQAAVFEPFMWLLRDLPVHRALLTIVALHLGAFALGMWWLLRRRLQVSPWAAGLGTSAAVGSGLVMSRSLQFEQIAVVAWVPWVLVGADLALDASGSRRRLALLPLSLALMVVSGHPQQVYLAIPLVVLWCVGRLLDRNTGWRGLLRLGTGALIGAGLSAAHLLPVTAALDASAIGEVRSIQDAAVPTNNALGRRLPATVLGDVGQEVHPFTAGSFEATAFLGAVATVLAVVAVLAWRRRLHGWTPLAMAVAVAVGATCSLGPYTPVYRVLYDHLPGFDLARVPARWMLLVVVGGAVLAALGLDQLRRHGLALREASLLAALLFTILALTRWGPLHPVSDVGFGWWAAIFTAVPLAAAVGRRRPAARPAMAAGIALLAVGELFTMSFHAPARSLYEDRPFTELADPLTRDLAAEDGRVLALTGENLGDPTLLVRDLRPNTNVIVGLRSIDGYDGGTQITTRWARTVAALVEHMDPELTLKAQVSGPLSTTLAARMGIRWLVVDADLRDVGSVAPGWRPAGERGPLVLLENPAWASSGRLVRRSVVSPDDQLAARLRSAPADHVVLRGSEPPLTCRGRCQPLSLQVARPRPGALRVELPAASPAGLVVVDEQLADGWQARVDGRAARLEVADGMLIGVRVPEGARTVELSYEAPGLRAGLWISGSSVVAVVLLTLLPVRRRRPAADLGSDPGVSGS